MGSLNIDSNCTMIQEIPVLLVCDDESLTLHEYMRLCERVYLELHGQNLGTRCFRIMEKKRYPSVDKSYVAAAQSLLKLDIHFKHMQWEYSHVRYRIIRRFNDDWRLMEPRLFDECAHIGVLGLRKYGTEMVSDDCNFRKPVSRRDALQSSQITKVICFNETCDLQPRIALFFWDIYRAILLETLTKTMDFQPLRNLKFRPGVVSGQNTGGQLQLKIQLDNSRPICSANSFRKGTSGSALQSNALSLEHPASYFKSPLSKNIGTVMSGPFSRRESSGSDWKTQRARRLLSLARLLLQLSAVQDGVLLLADAAAEFKASGDTLCYSSALITWSTVALTATNKSALIQLLLHSPMPIDESLPISSRASFDGKESTFSSVVHDTVGVTAFKAQLKSILSQLSEDDVISVAKCNAMAVCREAIQSLQSKKFAPSTMELLFASLSMCARCHDKKGVVATLRTIFSFINDNDVGAVNSTRLVQAAAIVSERAKLQRNSALFSAKAASSSSELRNWTGALSNALAAENALGTYEPKSSWTVISMLALQRRVNAAKIQGDYHALASGIVRCQHVKRIRAENCLHSDLAAYPVDAQRRNLLLRSSMRREQLLEGVESGSIQLPDRLWFKYSSRYCMHSLLVTLSKETHCCQVATLGSPSATHQRKIRIHEAADTFLFNPFSSADYPRSTESQRSCHSKWIVGERTVVAIAIQNPSEIPVFIHSCKFISSGSRCICHDLVPSPGSHIRVEPSYGEASILHLELTPLEPGEIRILGVNIRMSGYLTANPSFVKASFVVFEQRLRRKRSCPWESDHCKNVQYIFFAVSRQPFMSTSLLLLPLCGFNNSILLHSSVIPLKCNVRPGERLTLALVTSNLISVSPLDRIQVIGRSVGSHVEQTLIDVKQLVQGDFRSMVISKQAAYNQQYSPLFPFPDPNSWDISAHSLLNDCLSFSKIPTVILLEVGDAAKHQFKCEIRYRTFCGGYRREAVKPIQFQGVNGIKILHSTPGNSEKNENGELDMFLANESSINVLVGVGSRCSILRAGEQNANLRLSPSDPSWKGDHSRLNRCHIEWRIVGPAMNRHDGFGSLLLSPPTEVKEN